MHFAVVYWRHVRRFQAVSCSRHCFLRVLFFRCLWLRRLRRGRGRRRSCGCRNHHGRLTALIESVFPGKVHPLSPDRRRFGVLFRVHPVRLPNICVHEHHSEKHTTDEENYPRPRKPFHGFCQPTFTVFVESLRVAVQVKLIEVREHPFKSEDADSERNQSKKKY